MPFIRPDRADQQELRLMLEEYKKYKDSYVHNIKFDSDTESLSKLLWFVHEYFLKFYLGSSMDEVSLKLIQIFFDTATYDEIERDVKVTLEAQLGLIGGTMGLLTGFSILSGVEIVYYIAKFFLSLTISRGEIRQNSKIGAHLYNTEW